MKVTENKMKLLKENHGDFNKMPLQCISLRSKLYAEFPPEFQLWTNTTTANQWHSPDAILPALRCA